MYNIKTINKMLGKTGRGTKMTTVQEISGWFDEGVEQGATHMVVLCDTFDHEDYPVYIKKGMDVREYKPGEMQRIMEVYQLDPKRKDEQMKAGRVFNYDDWE